MTSEKSISSADNLVDNHLVLKIVNDYPYCSKSEDTSKSRFQDFNQLLFSLRSLETYAPWIRNVFIVTNGQKPDWLNLTTATVISHDQIFEKKEDLPTFNSRAIESHLHQIPGLSENFLYFNDDWAFTNHICPSDFWTAENGYQGQDLNAKFISDK